jgi:hypothetical protein
MKPESLAFGLFFVLAEACGGPPAAIRPLTQKKPQKTADDFAMRKSDSKSGDRVRALKAKSCTIRGFR